MTFKTILMDPPWNERGGGKVKRGADRHYPLMVWQDIVATINRSGVWDPDPAGCHVWCWVTDNHLLDGLRVLEALGVRYIRTFVWNKIRDDAPKCAEGQVDLFSERLQIGLGQYARGTHELMLFGRCGKTMLPEDRSVPSSFFAPRTEHSRKPEISYKVVERISPEPRLEMFARRDRAGWKVWGNEVGGT